MSNHQTSRRLARSILKGKENRKKKETRKVKKKRCLQRYRKTKGEKKKRKGKGKGKGKEKGKKYVPSINCQQKNRFAKKEKKLSLGIISNPPLNKSYHKNPTRQAVITQSSSSSSPAFDPPLQPSHPASSSLSSSS
jgi:hypothetical protein